MKPKRSPRDVVEEKSERLNVEKVIEELDRRRQVIKTIIVGLDLVFFEAESKKKIALNGQFFGGQNGNMRMRMKHGDSVVIDLTFLDDQVQLYLPRKKRFATGARKDVLSSSNNVITLLGQVGQAPNLFFPYCWTPQAVERRTRTEKGRDLVGILEVSGDVRKEVRRFFLNPLQPVCDSVELIHPDGQAIGTIVYDDYFFPKESGGSQDDRHVAVAYPRRITLETPDRKKSIQMNVETILHQDEVISPGKFQLTAPEGIKIENLGDALSQGKGLWD